MGQTPIVANLFHHLRPPDAAHLERAQELVKTIPCVTCPWRKSSTVGGADIPNFDIELMRKLSNAVGDGDDFRRIMACHGSACGGEEPCIGYVAVEGYSNLRVRIMAFDGVIDLQGIDEDCADLDLWPSFHEMLQAYDQ